jgi:pantoate--beta-alanine ligase
MNIAVRKTHVFTEVRKLQLYLADEKAKGASVGFVPTMGALHEGHISLVSQAKKENDVVIACIFVNPKQFNNPIDLKNYPRTPEKDITLLESAGIDAVFLPKETEIYPDNYAPAIVDLGELDQVMEGKFRPGHFKGVVNVVNRLFDIVQPSKAYFGKKDFQQVAVIKHFSKILHPQIAIVDVPTLRDAKGLALSSRNMLLTEEQKTDALALYYALEFAKTLTSNHTPKEVKKLIENRLNCDKFNLEYVELVDPVNLQALTDNWVQGATMCIAAFFGSVRLIDNMTIFPN